jgi:hypothetical protein
MTARLWLDLTGVTPGSDAAILAQRLAPALRGKLGERVRLCRRESGWQEVAWDHLAALSSPPIDRMPPRTGMVAKLAQFGQRLPPRTRTAIRRAVALQLAVFRALRPPPPDAGPVSEEPAELPPGEICLALARCHLEAAGTQVTPTRIGLPDPGFVLADGVIGRSGDTQLLLLAWRRLLDGWHGSAPRLVIAGQIGPLADDVLTQLYNSCGFEGTVTLFGNPTEAERAGLRAACCFTLALEPHSVWGRATLDSLQAGVACLSVFSAPGATPLEPGNATAMAAALHTWLTDAPPPPAPPARGWDDVARDVIAALWP